MDSPERRRRDSLVSKVLGRIIALLIVDFLLVVMAILICCGILGRELGELVVGLTIAVCGIPLHLAVDQALRTRLKAEPPTIHEEPSVRPSSESVPMQDRQFTQPTLKTLLSRADLNQVIGAMKAQIGRDYRDQELVVVGVHHGALQFAAALQLGLKLPASVQPLILQAFDGCVGDRGMFLSSDVEAFILGEEQAIRLGSQRTAALVRRKRVLIVDDMVISGTTLWKAAPIFTQLGALSVECAVLVEKRGELLREYQAIKPKYIGVSVNASATVVGFGMDWAGQFRNEPGLCQLIRSTRDSAIDPELEIVVPNFRRKPRDEHRTRR